MSGSQIAEEPAVAFKGGEEIRLTRADYEALMASVKPVQTITITVAEYNELLALKTNAPSIEALKQERDRFASRMRELETVIRREQNEHAEEMKAAVARIKQLGG